MRKRDRGAALLLVLGAVAILAVLAVELAARASADSLRAARSARDAAFRRLFESGGEIARGLLAESEPPPFTHWGQPWNRSVRFALGPAEEAVVRLADESGKIAIGPAALRAGPATARRRVERLFQYLRKEEPRRGSELKDMEARVVARLESKEPLVTLDGLREAGLSADQVFGENGLARHLTCIGEGKVNVNTALRPVLFALSDALDEALVDRIASRRGRGEGAPGTYRAFEEVKDLLLVDGMRVTALVDGRPVVILDLYEKVAGLFTVKSACFSARVEARAGGGARVAWHFLTPEAGRVAFEEIFP